MLVAGRQIEGQFGRLVGQNRKVPRCLLEHNQEVHVLLDAGLHRPDRKVQIHRD